MTNKKDLKKLGLYAPPRNTLFGRAGKDSIRVAYVHPTRGIIDNVSVKEANKYAKKNPGTTFMFWNREKLRYLTINEVNNLTVDDIKTKEECEGISVGEGGGPNRPALMITGCGGIGAAANAIVGDEGSVIAVDLVRGGWGYKCPPKVTLLDDGKAGKTKFQSVLGITTTTIEMGKFEFEEYDVPEDDTINLNHYNEEGRELGEWDPNLYLPDHTTPNLKNIEMYSRFMRNFSQPWWHTRKVSYANVSSLKNFNRLKYDVQHHKWGAMETSTDSVVVPFEVYSSGSVKNRSIEVEFVAQDKSHRFTLRGVSQNFSQFFRKEVKLNTTYDIIPKGRKGTKIEQQLLKDKSFGSKGIEKGLDKEAYGDLYDRAKGRAIFLDIIESANDNDDLQILARRGEFKASKIPDGDPLKDQPRNSHILTYRIDRDPDPDDSFMNKYAISPVPPSDARGSAFPGHQYIMKWYITFPIDGEYKFQGIADDEGYLYFDGEPLGKLKRFKRDNVSKFRKTITKGVHEVRIDLMNFHKYKFRDVKYGSIFNTRDHIKESKQKLWKMDPETGNGDVSNFLNQFGVTPFKPKLVAKAVNDFGVEDLFEDAVETVDNYAEVQRIVWDNVEFPAQGETEYELEFMARDKADIKIINLETKETKTFEYHLRYDKKKKSVKTRTFAKGKYKIVVELEQNRTKPVIDGKYMSFAMNIKTKEKFTRDELFEKNLSWQDNPMGVALAITAPKPPRPRLEKAKDWDGEGCPPNPLWSTRVRNKNPSIKPWWPVIDPRNKWSTAMEQYAISPVVPSGERGSDTGAEYYKNSWTVGIAHTGTYGLKGNCDKHGMISIKKEGEDSKLISIIHTNKYEVDSSMINKNGDNATVQGKLFPAGAVNPGITTFRLEPGNYIIDTEVKNSNTDIKKRINQKIFHTADWVNTMSKPPRFVEVFFNAIAQGTVGHRAIEFVFTEKLQKGYTYKPHTFTIKNPKINGGRNIVSVRLKPNTPYDVRAQPVEVTPAQNMRRYIIQTMGSSDSGRKRSSEKEIEFDDNVGDGFDKNASLKIESTSPGIRAEFSPSGQELLVYGRGKGTVDLKFEWNDKPSESGLSVDKLTVGDVVFEQKGRRGKKEKTLELNAIGLAKNEKNSGVLEQGTLVKRTVIKSKDFKNDTFDFSDEDIALKVKNYKKVKVLGEGKFKDGESRFIFADYLKSANDNDDMKLIAQDGMFTPTKKRIANKNQGIIDGVRGRSTYDLEYRFDLVDQSDYIKSIGDTKFTAILDKDGDGIGDEVNVTAYRRVAKSGPIGLRMTPVFMQNIQNIGKTWRLKWDKVDFPKIGNYRIRMEGDDVATLFIDGEKICSAKKDGGLIDINYNVDTIGKKTIEVELKNRRDGTDKKKYTKYSYNTTFVAVKITTPIKLDTEEQESWAENPIGISGALIPPPCKIKGPGKGPVVNIVPDPIIPGNGYPPPPPPPVEPEGPEDPEPGPTPDLPPPPGLPEGPEPPDGPDTPTFDIPKYDVLLFIDEIGIGDGGINYNCAGDEIVVIPDNGAKLEYDCDTFGRIKNVRVVDPGAPVTRLPIIKIISDTGINARFVPSLKVVRDPVLEYVDDPSKLLTVTDLVGIKRTGYYNGRAYYGSVYYDDGVKYAGYYKTPGKPVRIYDTLQESITGEEVSNTSPVIRLGTDIQSNDQNLRLPGTPDNLV